MDAFWSNLLNDILKALLVAVVAQLVGFVFILGRMAVRYASEKLAKGKYAGLLDFVHEMVRFAEQHGIKQAIEKQIVVTGKEKFEMVTRAVVDYADKNGLRLDYNEIVRLVESTVMDEFNRQKVEQSIAGK